MKSPQFSTWSPSRELTKGGSVIGAFGAGEGVRPLSFQRESSGFLPTREMPVNGHGVVVPAGQANTVPDDEPEDQELAPVPAWKRIFDIAAIVLSLPVTLPLGLVIVAWVKVVSPGPVFYRQARIGRGGRIFNILKFRSMKVDAPTSTHEQHLEHLIKNNVPMTKLDGEADPRIIPGGRCLRAMGLDELPQLINVLRGDMSLVGPRPSTPKEYQLFTPEQKSRAAVLPGLTGYWQVSGKNKLTFQQMIDLDLQYIAKLSFGLDLAIVVATIPAMMLQFMESRTVTPSVGPMAAPPATPPSAEPTVARAA